MRNDFSFRSFNIRFDCDSTIFRMINENWSFLDLDLDLVLEILFDHDLRFDYCFESFSVMRQQRRRDRVHKIENDVFWNHRSFFSWLFWCVSRRFRSFRSNAQSLSIRFWRRSRWFDEWSSFSNKNKVFSSSWNMFDNQWVLSIIVFLNYWDKQSNLSLIVRSIVESFSI